METSTNVIEIYGKTFDLENMSIEKLKKLRDELVLREQKLKEKIAKIQG